MKREEIFQGLEHLRRGFLLIGVVVILLMLVLFQFSKTLLRHLYQANLKVDLIAFGVPETLLALLKLTLYASLLLAIPFIFYRIWKAFSPLFHRRGVTADFSIYLSATLLFYLGAGFCYFVTLPYGVQFLLSYQSPNIRPMISVGKYVSFCSFFVFGFGLTFELPLVLALLGSIRVVKADFLTRNRRYAVLFIAIVSAMITPTPDFFNMALMGGPLYLLFEVGVILVRIIEKKRNQMETMASRKD
jgi:sec-independent protein translocase protein TatC